MTALVTSVVVEQPLRSDVRAAFLQTARTAISSAGAVTDQAGASVPKARLRIIGAGTGQTRETQTATVGTCAFPSTPAIRTKWW